MTARLRLPMLACAAAFGVSAVSAQDPAATFKNEIEPLLVEYCFDCHADGVEKGDLALDDFYSPEDILEGRKIWETVLFNVENWVMPPAEKKKQPSAEEREKIVRYLDDLLFHCDCDNPDPGRVTIRRLNREEYNNTVRDLIGIDLRPADDFPADDTGYGFDTIGDVLALPPILVERYLIAADAALEKAIVTGERDDGHERFDPNRLRGGDNREGKVRILSSNGEIFVDHNFRSDGEYILRAEVYGDQAGTERVAAEIRLGDKPVQKFDVGATSIRPEMIEVRTKVAAGSQKVAVAFLNDFFEGARRLDRNLYVQKLEIEGPVSGDGGGLPESHRRIFLADPEKVGAATAARTIIRHFANRAFRRPAKAEEVEKLARFVDLAIRRGDSFEEGIKQALRACMVSPHFLFRIEWQPEPNNPERIHDISEFALASRLSYFLWSSMPDDDLLSLAFNNQLRANFRAQVLRMLSDPKADELAENFAGQWLEVRNLTIHEPDPQRFAEYDAELRDSMSRETETFFMHLLRENRSVLEFLSADYTFLNERLARHYGIDGVTGPQFQKVSLAGTPRQGILTHGSVLTVTSDPTRTSPVKRGKWVLENLLAAPPPPPPPNVPELEENRGELKGTLRERMEQHRDNPACASCHALMDPIGFGMENFDAVGKFRTTDGDDPIDSSGKLVTGEAFSGSRELSQILLAERRDAFVRALIKKMLTYALGRGIEWYDKCAINEIEEKLIADDYKFQTLILAIAESVPFQKRRGDGFRDYDNPLSADAAQ